MKPGYILRRLVYLLVTFFIIITLSFFLMRFTPGGPFTGDKTDARVIEQLKVKYGYDQPLLVQYGRYVANILRGNLGPSTGVKPFGLYRPIKDLFYGYFIYRLG